MWDTVYKMLRALFFALDRIVFGLIGDVYGLLLQICRTSVFDTDAIHSFSSRIYVFIGLFMLFKLSISLITYLLNPDDFAKGDKNFGKIVKNAILALVMVVLCPYVFTELFELQSIILEENTIMNVAFGTPNNASGQTDRISNATYADSAGGQIQFTLAFAFAQPNYQEFSHSGIADLIDCRYTYLKGTSGNFTFRDKAIFDEANDEGKKSRYIYNLFPACWGVYDKENDMYVQDGINGQLIKAFADAGSEDAYQDYAQGVAQQSYSLMFKKEAIVDARASNGKYVINYKFGISTAVGIGTLYLLLMFCIDLAVRSVKLGFLQMIAPIPILSYVDPKSGKDGMFNKWFKSVKNTYLDLFIRLFALYFGIYVITLVGRFRDVVTGEVVDNWIVRIFMILGVLIFVKKLPEFLKDALGFEGSGTFKNYLNPLKKIEEDAMLGKNITGAAAGLAGGAVGMLTGAGLARGITGGIGGALGGKGWKDTWKNTKDRNAKLRTANLVDRNPFRRTFGRVTTGISDAIGTGGALAEIERRESDVNRQIDAVKAQKEEAENRLKLPRREISQRQEVIDKIKSMQDRAVSKVKQGTGTAGQNYQQMLQAAENIKNARAGATGSVTYYDAKGNAHTANWNDSNKGEIATLIEQNAEGYANKAGRDHYMDNENDAVINNARIEYNTIAKAAGISTVTGAEDLDTQSGRLNTDNANARSQIYQQEQNLKIYDEQLGQLNDEMRSISNDKKRHESYRNK